MARAKREIDSGGRKIETQGLSNDKIKGTAANAVNGALEALSLVNNGAAGNMGNNGNRSSGSAGSSGQATGNVGSQIQRGGAAAPSAAYSGRVKLSPISTENVNPMEYAYAQGKRGNGYTIKDFALENDLRSENSLRAKDFNSYLTSMKELSGRVQADLGKRSGKYQTADSFGQYRNKTDKELADLSRTTEYFTEYFTRYGQAYDEVYGEGASRKILDGLGQNGKYLSDVRSGLSEESEYWNQFSSEQDWRMKSGLDTSKSVGAQLEEVNRELKIAEESEIAEWQKPVRNEGTLQAAIDHSNNLKQQKKELETYLSEVQAYEQEAEKQKQYEEHRAKMEQDTVEAAQARIAETKRKLTQQQGKEQTEWLKPVRDEAALDREVMNTVRLQEELAEQEAYLEELTEYKALQEYSVLPEKPGFERAAAIGGAFVNPELQEVNKLFFGKEPVNPVTFGRDNQEEIALELMGDSALEGQKLNEYRIWQNMTEEEVKIHNALLAESEEKARKYRELLLPELQYRAAREVTDRIKEMPTGLGKGVIYGTTAFTGGLHGALNGMAGWFSDKPQPPDPVSLQAGMLGEDLEGLGKYAYSALGSIGQMSPSLLVGALAGPVAAGGVTWAGVGGAAYQQALSEGYEPDKARTYGVLVGASEATLQYLIGGISKLGGVTDDILLSKVAAMEGAFKRVALTGAVKIGSEEIEENLQNFLEPAFRTLLFGEKYTAPSTEETLETIIVTAMTTGLLEGGEIWGARHSDTASRAKMEKQIGEQLRSRGDETLEAVVQMGLHLGKETEAYQTALKLQKKMESSTIKDEEIGRLFTQIAQETNAKGQEQQESGGQQSITKAAESQQAPGVQAPGNPGVSPVVTSEIALADNSAADVDNTPKWPNVQAPGPTSETALSGELFTDSSISGQRQAVNTQETGGKSAPNQGENTRLTKEDLDDYLKTGEKKSVRDAKQAAVHSGEDVILTSPWATRVFIQDAISGEAATTKAYGKVGASLANDVYSASDGKLNIKDWYLELTPYDLRHAFNGHSEAKKADNIPLSLENFLNIPEYIDTYDDILDVKEHASGDKTITLGKKINGYSVIVELVSGNRHSIHFKTMWGVNTEAYQKRYKKGGTASPQTVQAISANDLTRRYRNASGDSINENAQNVNTQEAGGKFVPMTPMEKLNQMRMEEVERNRKAGEKNAVQGEDWGTRKNDHTLPAAWADELGHSAEVNHVPKETEDRVRRISKILGLDVRFYTPRDGAENGHWDSKNRILWVSAKSENPVAQIIGHELTHGIENAKHYHDLERLTLREVQRTTGKKLRQLQQEKISLYSRHGVELNEEKANRELVAEYVERHLLTDEAKIREIAQNDPGLGRRILDKLHSLLARFRGQDARTEAFLNRAANLYSRVLRESREQGSLGSGNRAGGPVSTTNNIYDDPLVKEKMEAYENGEITEEEYDAFMDERDNGGSESYFSISGDSAGDQFSISEEEDGTKFVDVPSNELTGIATKDVPKALAGIVSNKFYDLIQANGQNIAVQQRTANEWSMSRDARDLLKRDPIAYSDKVQAFGSADELLQASRAYVNEELKHVRKDDFVSFARGNVDFRVNRLGYTGDIIVGITNRGEAVLYDVVNIDGKEIVESPKVRVTNESPVTVGVGDSTKGSAFTGLHQGVYSNSIRRNSENSNMQNEESGKSQYSFGGRNAGSADMELLRKAQEMEHSGVAMETIFRDTGWYTGADGKWRFEIDDSGMEYSSRGDFGESPVSERPLPVTYLSDYIRHDELFEAYPELREAKLRFAKTEDGERGSYNPKLNLITLDKRLQNAPESELLHEVQHAIQRREGFTAGANPKYWERKLAQGYDGRTAEERRRHKELLKQYDDVRENQPEFFQAMEELNAMVPDMPREEINRDGRTAEAKEDPIEWQQYDKAREAVEQRFGEDKVWDFMDLQYMIQKSEEGSRVSSDLYYDTAGEIEARDVSNRRSMTAEERRNKLPDIGDENTVFAEGAIAPDASGKMQFSISEELPDPQGKKAHREAAISYFGTTYNWNETGYLLTNGKKLDFSGKNQGASGGYRAIDHREIIDALSDEYSGAELTDGMVRFMNEGNIRIMPEGNGMELSVMPTKSQMVSLENYISRVRGEVTVDLSNSKGDVVASAEYPRGTHSSAVLADITRFFEEGIKPNVSEWTQFSISEELPDELDALLERPFPAAKGEIVIGETSDYLVNKLQAQPLRVTMPANKAYAAMVTEEQARQAGRYNRRLNYHGLGRDRLIRILKASEAPLAAFAAPTGENGNKRDNRIVLVTDQLIDGKNAVVITEMNSSIFPRNHKETVNKDITVYPRGQVFQDILRAEAEGRLLDLDKKKSHHSLGILAYNSLEAIREDDFATNIRNFWENVNYQNAEKRSTSFGTAESNTLRKAFEDAGWNGEQFSISEEAESGTETEKQEVKIRDAMPGKARNVLRRTERGLLQKVSNALGVPAAAGREYLQGIVEEMSNEFLESGRISTETRDRLFDTAYEQGIVADDEFYNENRELKEHLRNTAVTISREDAQNIADYQSFKKSAFGALKIVNEGGLPVDTAYQELSERNPGLFPDSITHPAEQLMRMLQVGKCIQKAEKTLAEYYGEEAEAFRKIAKYDFDAAVNDTVLELRNIQRFLQDRAEQEETQEIITTQEEVEEAYNERKAAKRAYEKARSRNLLTKRDEMQVGRLLRGEIELRDLNPREDNAEGIRAVYEAKQEFERVSKLIEGWNDKRRAKNREIADELLETANSWKDKKAGIQYSRETMERNVRDIVKDPELAQRIIKEYFTPVHQAQAKSTRMKNEYRDRVRDLNLSTKETKDMQKRGLVSEAHAVQLLGEAMDNIQYLESSQGRVTARDGKTLEDWRGIVQDLWAMNPQLDKAKIENAIQEFRKIYDELFRKMNEVRLQNGYEPINYRRGYFPHFQPGNSDGIMGLFGKALGIETGVSALPTTINGLTHAFRPGTQWFGNAQERLGFNTAYDAVEGFDRYIEGASDVIYQTDNIQKLRALATQIRYRTGDEGLRQQIDSVETNTELSEEEKQNRKKEIFEKGSYALSNFVVELDEYTNLLANKKSRADRNMEQALSRDMYNLVKGLESRVAANMVAINPASWLTNFIPLTQGGAELGTGQLLKGMWQTLKAYKEGDGIVDASSFLTNRRGSDPLIRTNAQKASAVLSKPMEWIDNFTADSLVRARYNQNLKRGLSETTALEEADGWVAGVMADRSKGSMPTLFNRSNPLTKLFTQFQLEVNNQLSYLFKDMPRNQAKKGKLALAKALFKFFLGAWLYDELYEYIIGRRPALDPIGILNDTVGDLTGYELPNLIELGVGAISGDMPSFETDKAGITDAGINLMGDVAEELPFIGGLLGGGRLPINSALPDTGKLWNAATNTEWSGKKRLATAGRELLDPISYLVPPFGGGQAKKVLQSVDTFARGGSYTEDAEGNNILQYPYYTDEGAGTASEGARSLLFGKTATETGRDWVDRGFKNLSAKETAAYRAAVKLGASQREAYETLRKAQGEEKKPEKLDIILHSGLEEQEQIAMIGELFGKETQTESGELSFFGKLQAVTDAGATMEDWKKLYDANAEKEFLKMTEGGISAEKAQPVALALKELGEGAKREDKLQAIFDSGLTEQEQLTVIGSLFGDKETTESGSLSSFGKMKAASEAGLSLPRWEDLKKANADDEFLKLSEGGLDSEDAYDTAVALEKLDEEAAAAEKYMTIAEMPYPEEDKDCALSVMMGDAAYAKYRQARKSGVDTYTYCKFLRDIGRYTGKEKQEKVWGYINVLPLSSKQKDALHLSVYKESSLYKAPWH